MRRSGTTILFDILSQDPRFDAYYEPFSITREGAHGGGSGAQAVDFAARIRGLREAYVRLHPEVGDPSYFNYGAPRDARLELVPELSDHAREYLREMVDRAPDTLIKFVRMYEKLGELQALAPTALLVHVVRDPRRVVTSQLLGPGKSADRFKGEKDFFRHRGSGVLWASRALSDLLVQRPEHRGAEMKYDVRRVLLTWKHTFRQTFEAGRRLFGERYLLLRHEDLARDPLAWTRQIYARAAMNPDAAALAFAGARVTPPKPPLFEGSLRWEKAMRKVGLDRELHDAGYVP